MAKNVASDDNKNLEAKAAAFYFPALFGKGFYRSVDCIENAALNYGYSILRGIIARTLVAYGMEPCLGIHHRSELNQFNLADDIIEPFRPFVDLFVSSMNFFDDELTSESKHQLFNISNYLIYQNNKKFSIYSAIEQCVISLSQSYINGNNLVKLPKLIPLESRRYV